MAGQRVKVRVGGVDVSRWRAVRASVVGAFSVLPVFVTGSLSVVITDDIPLSEEGLGLLVAGFFAGSSAGALVLGPLADRWGPRRTTALGGVALCVAMVAVTTVATRQIELIGLMVLAGAANGAIQPASNLALSRSVDARRLGLAFGVKQAMIPAATMLAGLLLPLVGLTVGWRWAFAGLAAGALLLPVLVPHARAAHRADTPSRPATVPLAWPVTALLATTCGLAGAAAVALAGFYVPAAVAAGVDPAAAGLLLTVGSTAMIVTRLGLGWLADDRLPALPSVSALLAAGAVGYAVLAAAGPNPTVVLAGTLMAFGAGWGWPGLLFLATVRANQQRAGAATGIVQAGTSIGAISGSLGFGVVASSSYRLAWLLAAALAVMAFAVTMAAERAWRAQTSGHR